MKTRDDARLCAAASWVIWANATMWPALETSGGKCNLENIFGPVDAILGEQKWLLGDELSVADVAVASYVKYAQLFFRMNIGAGSRARPITFVYCIRSTCIAGRAFNRVRVFAQTLELRSTLRYSLRCICARSLCALSSVGGETVCS